MKTGLRMLVVVLLLAFVMVGCDTTSQGSKTYTRGQAQTAMQVYYGTVLSVADVTIAREESAVSIGSMTCSPSPGASRRRTKKPWWKS